MKIYKINDLWLKNSSEEGGEGGQIIFEINKMKKEIMYGTTIRSVICSSYCFGSLKHFFWTVEKAYYKGLIENRINIFRV